LVRSKGLESFAKQMGGADRQAFAEHFVDDRNNNNKSGEQSQNQNRFVAVFDNLGRNATLIAPKPINNNNGNDANENDNNNNDHFYVHLARFCRNASPPEQISEFWKTVASEYLWRLNNNNNKRPIWLSTSGMGIAWLHVRLDLVPKYYTFQQFKTIPTTTTSTSTQLAADGKSANCQASATATDAGQR
jgi:hypothetical protein